jgi:hypothetical protein
MARFAVGVIFGVVVGTVLGAAAGLHADEASAEVQAAAVAAHVDPVDLAGAVNSVGVDPYTYLRSTGELPPLPREPAKPPSVWDRLVSCEASGNWHANTGNGFAGGLQFTPGTWRSYGGVGSPAQASREAQIAVAERVLVGQGWKAWPSCSRQLGLR